MLCQWMWKCVKRHVTVAGTVVVFALVWILMLAVQSGDAGASWVQAIGSLIGIAIAISVPARQWKLVLKEKREDVMREDHQLALSGLKICLEVEELFAELEERNGGRRHEWHDKEYFRAKIEALHLRFGTLTGVERNAMWWNMFLDAKNKLMEVDAALRIHDVDEGVVRVLVRQFLVPWRQEIANARLRLAEYEILHRDVLHKNFWHDSATLNE